MKKLQNIDIGYCIHTLIGLTIMAFGRYFPAPSLLVETTDKLTKLGLESVDGMTLITITPIGMTVIGLFFGVIYLWTFADTLWPSFMGVVLLGMSNYGPMAMVLSKFMGNPMTVLIFFLFMFAAVLIKSNLSAYLARWFMTHKMIEGKPWLFTATILLATFCVAKFEQTSACFLIWPALYIVFDYVGFKKGDLYVTLMIVYTMMMALLSFATDPIKGGAFYLLTNMQNLNTPGVEPLNIALYFLFGITLSIICMLCFLFFMRFVFRVDASPLKNIDIEILKKETLPPLNSQQKIIISLFAAYACWMLLPGIIGRDNIVGAFMSQNALGGTLMVMTVLVFLRIDKKPVTDIVETNTVYPWRTYFLIATAFLLGGAMTGQNTNVTVFMEYFLRGHLSGLNETALTVAIIIIAIVATNFCNSVVAGLVFTPVILSMAAAFGFDPNPIIACFFYVVLVAAATPAASPFAAILYDNGDWIAKKDVAIHTVIASVIVVAVVLVIGIPLAKILF